MCNSLKKMFEVLSKYLKENLFKIKFRSNEENLFNSFYVEKRKNLKFRNRSNTSFSQQIRKQCVTQQMFSS